MRKREGILAFREKSGILLSKELSPLKPVLFLMAAAAAVTVGAWGCCQYAFASPRGRQNDDHALPPFDQLAPYRDKAHALIRRLNKLPWERVYITSYDGLRLAGRYYHTADGAPLDICFHGYRGTPSRDFSGGAQMLLSMGHNVLLAEQRAQCGSQGRYITMGVKERYDCLDWIRWGLDRFGPEVSIVLYGISMGASTVLMASGMDLPPNVKGVAADCPFTSPSAIVRSVLQSMHASALYPLLALGTRLFGGFSLKGADAAEAVGHARVPILLIHGEDDRFVPCGMSRAIAAANPAAELHVFPGAGHGISFLTDEERYKTLLERFSRRVLGE